MEWLWEYITKIDNENYEIQLFEEIGEWGFSSNRLNWMLSEIESEGGKNVNILFNSPGGDAFEGIAMYNLLNNSRLNITGTIVGIAASAAGIIFMGCKNRAMYPHSMIMVHRVTMSSYGNNPDELRKQAEDGEKIEAQTKDIFVRKTGQSQDIVDTWFDGSDHWFNGAESILLNICTQVIDNDITPDAATEIAQKKDVKAAWYQYKHIYNHSFHNDMLRKRLIQLFKLTQQATDDEVAAVVEASINSNSGDTTQLQADLAATKAELQAYKDAEAATKAAETTTAETAINQAFQKGTINDRQKASYMQLAKVSPKEVLNLISQHTDPKLLSNILVGKVGETTKELTPAQKMQQYYDQKNNNNQ
jgi:ATP-dependent protease ClpP protease subunit